MSAKPNNVIPYEPQSTTVATPMEMMAVAVAKNMSPETIKGFMELQERHERNEAARAYNVAFAAFKAEAIHIIKNKAVTDGPLKGKRYAELFSVVNAVTPALSKHGLSASWKITKDEPNWIEVTCTLKHVKGHAEMVSMGGPPDMGGAKNSIQARASTVNYLERYTLKAVCGVAEAGEDNDGNGGKALTPEELGAIVKKIEATTTKAAAKEEWAAGVKVCRERGDVASSNALKEALIKHGEFIDSTKEQQ